MSRDDTKAGLFGPASLNRQVALRDAEAARLDECQQLAGERRTRPRSPVRAVPPSLAQAGSGAEDPAGAATRTRTLGGHGTVRRATPPTNRQLRLRAEERRAAAPPRLRGARGRRRRDRLRLGTECPVLPGGRHQNCRGRTGRPGLEAGRRTTEGERCPGGAVRPGWPVAALRRQQLRRGAVHVDNVHDPRRRCRSGRVAAGAQAGRNAALRRARAGPRRAGPPLAAPPRADPEAPVRRLSPHPADCRDAYKRRLHDQGTPKSLGANSLGTAVSA